MSSTYGNVELLDDGHLRNAVAATRQRLAEPAGVGRVAMRNLDTACADWLLLSSECVRRWDAT